MAAVVAVALSLPAGAMAGAAGITVEAGDENRFSPKNRMWGLISSNFYWSWGDAGDGGVTERRHNVRQDQRLFSSGDPTKSPPGGPFIASVSAGTFRYHCIVHGGPGGEGMSGRVKVAPSKPTMGTVWATPGVSSTSLLTRRANSSVRASEAPGGN